jgi:methyl-accepting chemotaxis protein
VKGSLRRTLALRFAATMAAGLLLATGAFYWAASRELQQSVPPAELRADLLLVLASIVVAGTAATLMGAWHFTSSAVRPVAEITAQATRIEAGTLDQRILAHADTEEYEGLVGVLNRMLERLERGFAVQRRLTADVSLSFVRRSPRSARDGGGAAVAALAARSTSRFCAAGSGRSIASPS